MPTIQQPPGTGLLRRPPSVRHTPSAQLYMANTAAYRHFPTHCSIPQRRTATCPERGSARGKSGLRNSECLSPSQTCPRQSVPLKGKEPTPKCPPGKEKSPRQSVPPLERKSPPPGAYVRRPTLYNIWYNFLINFINTTFPCIL